MDLPIADREDTPEPVKVQREGEGLIATLERLAKGLGNEQPEPKDAK